MSNSSILYQMFTEVLEVVDDKGRNSTVTGIAGGTEGVGLVLSPDPLDRDDDQRSTGQRQTGAGTYHSVQRDLSHIIADMRFASQCSAMVGTFDSRFAVFMRSTMCGVRSICPPSVDLGGAPLPLTQEGW